MSKTKVTRQPKLRTMAKMNTGTRRHKTPKDYSRKAKFQKQEAE
jgi:hypothetical protein